MSGSFTSHLSDENNYHWLSNNDKKPARSIATRMEDTPLVLTASSDRSCLIFGSCCDHVADATEPLNDHMDIGKA